MHKKIRMNQLQGQGRDNKNAFFSVEAAMIIPLAVFAVLLAVSLFVYQYDRCLMEQDMGAQALKAASAEAGTSEELGEKIEMQAAGLYRDKYVAWDMIRLEVRIKRGIVEAIGEGMFRFPVPAWNLWNKENVWTARAEYKTHRTDPVAFIRNCRKIISR